MNFPIEFENRMKSMLGNEYNAFLAAFDAENIHKAVRVNSQKEIPEELKGILSTLEPVKWCKTGYYTDKDILDGNSPYHLGGLLYFQEPSAMAVVSAITINPDDYVLDLCAAPGGKATHAGEFIGEGGLLVANEIVKKRAVILADNIERMGIKNAVVTNESPKRLEERFPEFFNKIIVDAPCSGEGMFRKEPQAVEEWSVSHTEACATRQKLILDSAMKMLAPGGELIYSTCTFAPCENEGVVDYILKNYPDIELVPITLHGLSPAVSAWAESETDMKGAKRIFPHHQKGEGHFLALFRKRGEFVKKAEKISKKEPAEAKLYREFEKEFLKISLSGRFELFGENLYLAPEGIDLNKLKVERAGLFLGKCRKGRFEPSHALALALKRSNFVNTYEAEDIKKYLRGETLEADIRGWCAVTYQGIPLGWAKGSQGILKNHFPKYMRVLK